MSIEESRLNELKSLCVQDESADAHAAHAAELEQAYRAFAGRQTSNPATPGAVTEVSADLLVAAEVPSDPYPDDAPSEG